MTSAAKTAVRQAAVLYPTLVLLMLTSVAVAAARAVVAETAHWLPEFPRVWRYLRKDQRLI